MAKKTNKTSHLLNLLTSNTAPEEQEAASVAQEPVAETPVQTTHPVSPTKVTVVDEGSLNDRLSQEILSKLSEELEPAGDTTQTTPVAQPDSPATQATVPQNTAPAVQTAAPQNELPAAQASVPQVTAPVAQSAVQTASTPQDQETISIHRTGARLSDQLHAADESFHFINVMEELIMQHDLDTILRQYNVCTCTRCKADVCALTLTGLPAKYVVASDHSLSPILNYYKNRYRISILAELSKACNAVREHPHHQR